MLNVLWFKGSVMQNRSSDGDNGGVVSDREGQGFLLVKKYLHLKDKWKIPILSLYSN